MAGAGDYFRKVTPGEALKIPAEAWNAFIETAQHDRASRFSHRPGSPNLSAIERSTVLILNNSGANADQYSILGIDVPAILPSDSQDRFNQQIILNGVSPTSAHVGKFVILTEPIATGNVGVGVLAGACQVQLNVIATTDKYAEVASGVSATLKTGTTGSAQILWKDSGTGTKWGIVRLGVAYAGPIWVKLSSPAGSYGANAPTPAAATLTYTISTLGGSTIATSVPVAFARQIGHVTAATNGLAQQDQNGNWQILVHDEVIDAVACSS